ncbi:hypothetical protein BOW53_04450 [Solemya pervernicosa gill symbiont]|uniref:RRM domain-containing protein n=2 Tax=Solemya pervernicosa gill symbiont TaxID=642797 RepID=A0A1T2L800_9GAMM|nr:hypothetical protein BOW53_04450 [Solemya pervernicosa gill symbiont]
MFFISSRGEETVVEVIVRNLHERVTESELETLFKAFRKKADITLVAKAAKGASCRYGLALFHSKRHAQSAIKQLDGKPLHGQPVILREFIARSYGNERRTLGWRNRVWSGAERRQHERRFSDANRPIDDFDQWLSDSEKPAADAEMEVEGYREHARKS